MLKSLNINNYALIQELNIEFDGGFSTLTGETGAGKSILLGALSLALGNRAESSILNNTDAKCIIEASFNIKGFNLKKEFSELDVDYDDLTIIRREITPTGKSRAFINDTPVNLNELKTLSSRLVDIHSQHENLTLNNNIFQMKVLDGVAKNSSTLSEYQNTYKSYIALKRKLIELEEKTKLANTDSEYNQFQFNQLNEINLESLNQAEIEQELEVLNNAEDIQISLANAFSLLANNELNSIEQLKLTKQAFDKIKSFYPKANDFANRIESCFIELQDIANDTETAAESIEYNSERISQIKEQLDHLYALLQKHQATEINQLIKIRNNLESELLQEESYTHDIEKLTTEIANHAKKLEALSENLSLGRTSALPSLELNISVLLSELGMPHANFKVDLQNTEDFTASGTNSINFMFSANKNHAAQNISKIASGGEISRLMLSIKYILSQSIALPTIIFDEIDTGVSGDIADKMANIMRNMAKNMQVISITHLPQIAAKGQAHYRVFKQEINNHTATKITKLNNSERIEEIAKMLSGEKITPEAIENAKSLIEL